MDSVHAVELKGVVKRYNEILAVNNVDLNIKKGEVFGLLGPNGSGKSTTMKMLLGLVQPDAGSVTVLGVDVHRDPVAVKQQIGYVPESPRLYEFLTGIEYLDFVGDVYGMQAAEKKNRINEYLKALQLEGREGDMITGYSEGMKQKLKAQGVTTIISTHVLEIAQAMCDRVGIMYKGQLLALGNMSELRQMAKLPDSGLEDIFLKLTGTGDVRAVVEELLK
jgi:ABC-2 type transport system ATP-binding protein